MALPVDMAIGIDERAGHVQSGIYSLTPRARARSELGAVLNRQVGGWICCDPKRGWRCFVVEFYKLYGSFEDCG